METQDAVSEEHPGLVQMGTWLVRTKGDVLLAIPAVPGGREASRVEQLPTIGVGN